MKVEVRNRCSDFNSYRAARVKSLFNVETGANFNLDADLPVDDADGLSAAVDLVVTAHSWEIVPASVLAACHHGGIGYHPSLLPRHPGRHAVEDTIAAGDTVAGGSVYRLTERIDGGPVLARDSVPVLPGETAAGLWRRALSPMGLALLARVVLDLRLGRHETEPEFDGVGVA